MLRYQHDAFIKGRIFTVTIVLVHEDIIGWDAWAGTLQASRYPDDERNYNNGCEDEEEKKMKKVVDEAAITTITACN